MGFKSMNYLDTYKKFIESNKIFFVKFYKEYDYIRILGNSKTVEINFEQ